MISKLYIMGDTPLHRLHPSTKIILVITFIFLGLTFQHPLPLSILLLIELILAKVSKFPRILAYLYLGMLLTSVGISLTTWMPLAYKELIDPGPLIGQFNVFGHKITITRNSILFSVGMGLRYAVLFMPTLIFLLTTSPREIVLGLRQLGVPFPAAYLLSMAFRFVPMAAHDASIILDAQKSRALELEKGSLTERVRKYAGIIAPLTLITFSRIQTITNALYSRMFRVSGKGRTYYHPPKLKLKDKLVIFCCISTCVICYYIGRVLDFLLLANRI